MKKIKKLFSFALVLCFMLSLSLSAFAASHDVGDFAGLENVFDTDTDSEVNINLTADVTFDHYLHTNDGQTYTIGSSDGHGLSNVMLNGDGEVVINTDLSSDGSDYALSSGGTLDVTVNGDINAQDGIYAGGSTTVTINGDVYGGKGHAVVAFINSQVIVEGDVSSEYIGIEAGYEADVTVNGDVYSRILGIHTTHSGDVTVNGDVSSSGWGIQTQKDSNVTVNGDVSSNYLAIQALDSSSISVGGDVSGGYLAIQAFDGSCDVTVKGDVSGGDFGIHTGDSATVTVGGNVSAADGDSDQVDFSDPESYVDGGYAIIAENASSVVVSGDAIGGDAYGAKGSPGRAVEADDTASVTVGGRAIDGEVFTSKPEPAPSASSIPMAVEYADQFWQEVTRLLRNAAPGEEITVDAAERVSIPMSVINTVIEQDVTLIVKWSGGNDITISPVFELDKSIYEYNFSELVK